MQFRGTQVVRGLAVNQRHRKVRRFDPYPRSQQLWKVIWAGPGTVLKTDGLRERLEFNSTILPPIYCVFIPSGYEPVERLIGYMGVRILQDAPIQGRWDCTEWSPHCHCGCSEGFDSPIGRHNFRGYNSKVE